MDQSISFLAEPGTVSIHLEEITVNTKPLLHMSLQMYYSLQVSFSYYLCVYVREWSDCSTRKSLSG